MRVSPGTPAGLLGRQTRSARGGGGARRQVYRGDPAEGDQGDLVGVIGSALQFMRERQQNPPAASVGTNVDPRVTALEAGLQENSVGLAATTKLAQEGLNVAKQTLEALGRLSAGLEARSLPAAPAPPVPPPYAYWNGLGGLAPPTALNQPAQRGAHGGGGIVPPFPSAPAGASHTPSLLPSFAGAGASESGGSRVSAGAGVAGEGVARVGVARAGVAAAGVAGAAVTGVGVRGSDATMSEAAGAGVGASAVVVRGVAGAGVAGVGMPSAGMPGAGSTTLLAGEVGAVAPQSQGSAVGAAATQEATEGTGRGRGATQSAGGGGTGGSPGLSGRLQRAALEVEGQGRGGPWV